MSGVIAVASAGLQTTVQDLAGRPGYWHVGVPPSGAWDELSFELANAAVGNAPRQAGLEAVMTGPVLRFSRQTVICLAGAATAATVDGTPVRPGVVTTVQAGATLDLGRCGPNGLRGYLAVAGGIDVQIDLGSRATFLLGGLGGHHGRALRAGDELPLGGPENCGPPHDVDQLLPALTRNWELRVLPGPHGAPDHLTDDGVAALWSVTWRVDHRADRTGIRLVGPAPQWSRRDGGEAGLHPSNIHDSAYPVGGVMLSGDTPVIVGPDGPSLGGFVVPCVVIRSDRWKLAQLRPGDDVRLVPVRPQDAAWLTRERDALLATRRAGPAAPWPAATSHAPRPTVDAGIVLAEQPATPTAPQWRIARAGDHHVLLEAGQPQLDLAVRLWVHLLAEELRAEAAADVTEIVEGVRSLLVAVDEHGTPPEDLADLLTKLASRVGDPANAVLDVREITLPIAFDHPLAHEAMTRYARAVRPDAPWCPDNVEFIRRVNDLDGRGHVFDIVEAATYLVVGLGDVYLGAPVAVPLDPRHRLVTTKYDPARTWTPQNAVGIGGVYLCIYGMEGPGGYQLVGRTVPVWRHIPGTTDEPWLLRQFDRLRFRPVTAEELDDVRADIAAGRRDLDAVPATFTLAEVDGLERQHAGEITDLRRRRRQAFDAERERWLALGSTP